MRDLREYNWNTPDFTDVAKQMRINIDILKKELTDHVDKEIARFKAELEKK